VTTISRRGVAVVRPGLWVRQDVLRAGLLLGVGVVLWVDGWYKASDDLDVDSQIAPLNLSVAGTLIAGAGFVAWFLAGRRAVGARRRALIETRRALVLPVADRRLGSDRSLGSRSTSPVLIAGSGLERFHRSDCPLAAGRTDWATASRIDHSAAGRVACGVCLP
jgi:hypothetical protein